MATPSKWFTSEIQQMMFSFGDSKRNLKETAELVEEIVQQQMVAMIEQSYEVAINRGDKHIGIEDIIFLLTKDKVKLKRLLQFFEVRDMRNAIKSTLESSEEVLGKPDIGTLSTPVKTAVNSRVMSKSRKICYNFLSSIDQTGELIALFDDKEIDVVKHERMLRAEMQSLGMDTEQYLEFCQARQTSFIRGNKLQRFRDWLQISLRSDIILTPAAIEIFSYLAYETVAQIVDLALLVKQDKRAHLGDQLSKTRPAVCINYAELNSGSLFRKSKASNAASDSQSYDSSTTMQLNSTSGTSNMHTIAPATSSKVSKKENATALEMSWDCTILPSDVREAMRRYFTDIGPFASQMKISPHCSGWHRTLCK